MGGKKIQGVVINKIQGFYYVESNNKVFECKLRGILKKTNNKYNCVVGDRVEISEDNTIVEIFKRDNMLIRPIVANVDYLAIQFAAKHPNIDFERINLLLLTAFYYKVKPIVIVNKIDYLTEEELCELKEKLSFLEKISVPMFLISCHQNIGLEKVENFLKDKITVIGGPSGVGKSSFINFLQSEKTLKTGEISEKLQRGKHTTRDSNMIKMKVGGYIIDTPGFSSIEVPNIENREELISLFPEFSSIESCKFLNCSHTHEPGCNVKKEVEENKISKDRYDFYKKTLEILSERWNRYD
ncbi:MULTISPECIES: ribosome small subunit-dependent GTPase A [Fusobacterium]|uniref:Small ribosomal subunit biogenesis GTPase RsgA n=1 Tax=Fusobacterium nucleatum TaxID=851 RepID=A0A133NQW8_FUSNU|nr:MULTISPECIES: ribosome small subunit-dependent GTPase A [Fusobacterium]KXA18682.1 ribosome small subunit-dependent GTPase A [Fusobacterium nucleatum]MCL4575994.1 ribosome biogenesis GTPase RsgA [Fusobacterium nucleatum YWH7056]MCL4583605.1 ribosome biogenesis GTPase RsgA [Fusobacterium nucleatum YWH7054]MCL4592242.1 ribosome biogenesis GTPase RsgA [Fusobacterium nucleatum YWH7053]